VVDVVVNVVVVLVVEELLVVLVLVVEEVLVVLVLVVLVLVVVLVDDVDVLVVVVLVVEEVVDVVEVVDVDEVHVNVDSKFKNSGIVLSYFLRYYYCCSTCSTRPDVHRDFV